MSRQTEIGHDLTMATAKVLPPVTVASLTLNEWVMIATVIYLVLQGAYLIWKWIGEWRKRRADAEAIEAVMAGPIAQPGDKAPRDA